MKEENIMDEKTYKEYYSNNLQQEYLKSIKKHIKNNLNSKGYGKSENEAIDNKESFIINDKTIIPKRNREDKNFKNLNNNKDEDKLEKEIIGTDSDLKIIDKKNVTSISKLKSNNKEDQKFNGNDINIKEPEKNQDLKILLLNLLKEKKMNLQIMKFQKNYLI